MHGLAEGLAKRLRLRCTISPHPFHPFMDPGVQPGMFDMAVTSISLRGLEGHAVLGE